MANGLNRRAFNLSAYEYWGGQYGVVNVKDFGAVGDGVHDDTAAIQAALDAADGAIVYFPKKYLFSVSKQSGMPNNVAISVAGPAHLVIDGTIQLLNNGNAAILFIQSPSGAATSDVTIEGTGTIDGNGINQTASYILGGIGTQPGSSNIVIRHLTIKNVGYYSASLKVYGGGISINGTEFCLLDSVSVQNCYNASAFNNGCSNSWVMNSTFNGMHDEGFAFYGGNYQCGIIGSTCYGQTAGSGISILNDDAQKSPNHDITVANNICYMNSDSGIECNSGQSPTVNNYNIIISGNLVFQNNQGNGQGSGITIGAGQAVHVLGNISHTNGNGTAGTSGIALDGTSHRCIIKDNTCYNNGQGGTNGIGIFLTNTTYDLLVEGNMLYDDQSTKTTAYQIDGGPTNNVTIRNNYIGAAIGPGSNYSLGTNNVFEANYGSSPSPLSVAGQTAGTIYWWQEGQQFTVKKVVVYLDAYENSTTTAQTITFPVAFAYVPLLNNQSGAPGITVTATQLSINPDTTVAYTGYIEVTGF